ncbi:MAG: TA system VapC family ribonuclease toxin [Terracidiphilus sp.]
MSIALLDVNALLALLWENHLFHARIARWFESAEGRGWATCPITEQGFVRIVSNPVYMNPAPGIRSALDLIQKTTEASKDHHFWADALPLSKLGASIRQRLQGHQQITDAYLLMLAIHHKGKLVTFDRRMLALAPEGSEERDSLELLT